MRCEQSGEPARVLLSLATGAGKTVIATNLLWRLHEAGRLIKPALFLCDRDELREQAYSKLSLAFPTGSVRMVETMRGQNAAKNAKVHIATYQTLGIDEDSNGLIDASFLTEHYPPDAFSVIVIDECHRSAWGRWSEVLKRNPSAIQIGLTATPRQLRESKKLSSEDAQTTADNLNYFGEPVYEYTLIEAQEDGYLAACEIVALKPSIGWKTFTKAEVMELKPIDSQTGLQVNEDTLRSTYAAEQFDNQLLIPERVSAMCADLFKRLCDTGGPEQKVIIFCNRDAHADRVQQQMQRLYAQWCKEQGQTPKDHYAFKCTSDGGADLIEPMRGSGERCFVACTVDLLGTGVDIERLNAVVFFRHLKSSITFYQMVGRGTRIHEETQKYKFWLYDYTGVTDLFGTDFITSTKKPRPAKTTPDGGNDDGDLGGGGELTPLPEIKGGKAVYITNQGHFIVRRRLVDGEMRDIKLPIEEYRKEMIQRVLGEAGNIEDFRALWVETQKRKTLIDHLLAEDYSPETVRDLMQMKRYDHFDMFAHYGYQAQALLQQERGKAYQTENQTWFASHHPHTAIVLSALGAQFAAGGTEALESEMLWQHPHIQSVGGLDALRHAGSPALVMMDAKLRGTSINSGKPLTTNTA